MSHFKERHEKICLNCNAELHGHYCHVCGQENKEPKDSFGHLFTHFVSDIFHFDGKFFSTAKFLLVKPGFLSLEYMRGRRASYLDPIRMYIFVSAIFFLVYFNVFKGDQIEVHNGGKNKKVTAAAVMKGLQKDKEDLETALQRKEMPVLAQEKLEEQLLHVKGNIALLEKDTTAKEKLSEEVDADFFITDDDQARYATVEAYDSAQQKLPEKKRDGWLIRIMTKKSINTKNKYGSGKVAMEQLMEKFQHSLPQLLFVSLPFFALILQLLYVRKKDFFYVNHIIYTLHLYSAGFVFIFIQTLISHLGTATGLSRISMINGLLSVYMLYYLYKSLRVFYNQKRGITILKFSLLLFLAMILVVVLFLFFIIVSLIRL